MDSNILIRYIIGGILGTAVLGLLLYCLIGYLYFISKALFTPLKSFFSFVRWFLIKMRMLPTYIKSIWLKVWDKFQILLCLCVLFCIIALMFHDCYGSRNNSRHHDQEEIESIVEDPQWNVPSRYRE